MTSHSFGRLGARIGSALLAVAVAGIAVASPAIADAPAHSNASAQGANVNIPGVYTFVASATPTTASNNGSGDSSPVVGAPGVLPSSTPLVESTGPLREVAQAGADGTSYACAGQGGILFNLSGTCQVTGGVSTTIMRLDAIPMIATALSSTVCPQMRLTWTTLYATASDNGAGGKAGSASVTNLHVVPCTGGTQPTDCRTLSVVPGSGANVDLLAAIIATMTPFAGCAPMVTALQGIQSRLRFTFNRQTSQGDGSLRVDALHLFTGDAVPASFDLGTVTVGPNAVAVVGTPMVSADMLGITAVLAVCVLGGTLVLRRRRRVQA